MTTCFACSNRSRTRLAPTPTNISTKSDPRWRRTARSPRRPLRARAASCPCRVPVEQHALRDPRAERLELLRVLEELLDLLELLDRLVTAATSLNVTSASRATALRAALLEAHHLRAAALDLVHDEEPEEDQQRAAGTCRGSLPLQKSRRPSSRTRRCSAQPARNRSATAASGKATLILGSFSFASVATICCFFGLNSTSSIDFGSSWTR